MILAIILLSICQVLVIGGSVLYAKHEITLGIERKQAEIEAKLYQTVHDWVKPGENNTPSQLAVILDSMGAVVGTAAARSIMASLSAEKAHISKAANGLSEVIEAQQNPILSLLSGGKRGKGAAIARLGELLMPMLQGRGGGTIPSDSGNNNRKSFSL